MQSYLKSYLFAVGSILVLFFLQFLGLLNFSWLQHQANVIKNWHYRWLLPVQQGVGRLRNFWQLSAKLEDLQYRYAEAAAQLAALTTLQQENQELRRLLTSSDRNLGQVVIAAPIVSFAKSAVTVGSNQGAQSGAAVLYQDNLLGILGEVSERQSEVWLLTNLQTQAIVATTQTGVTGLVQGNGREILLTEIAADAKVEVGELVYTGANVSVEAGLLIGRISQLKPANPALSTQVAVVEQLVNFYELAVVEIK